jgi:argininosuccinate lyase
MASSIEFAAGGRADYSMKLWETNNNNHTSITEKIERFTNRDDVLLDQTLVKYDVLGSIAHAAMLKKIGILTPLEFKKLKEALVEIFELNEKFQFRIEPEEEDVHTKVENFLTKKLGSTGKKVHTGRSRNDQVLVDLRLCSKEKLLKIQKNLLLLCQTLTSFAKKYGNQLMPGYTHLQRAMPSTVSLWAISFVEALLDDLAFSQTAFELNDQNPLGAAAGYGVPLKLDREYTANLLGFKKIQQNVLYTQNSRGKIEGMVISALAQIMVTLSKLSNDLILFSAEEFGFFEIPEEFKTGSSIMPGKRNPDILELIRARANKVIAYLSQAMNITKDLPSGYHRDFQEIKEPLLRGLNITTMSLEMMIPIVKNLKPSPKNLRKALSPKIFASDEVFELVLKGVPFREAYRQVEKGLRKIKPRSFEDIIKSRKTIGASGNLGLEKLEEKIEKEKGLLEEEKEKFHQKTGKLISG